MSALTVKTAPLLLATLTLSLHCSLQAAVTPAEAKKLGGVLTPVGAEQSANADGSIPAWTGGLDKAAGTLDSTTGRLSNPYASEQPLFIIDAQNQAQHSDKLSEGQRAMFKRYPDSYRLRVFPSYRSAALPEFVYQAAARNAVNTRLLSEGNGLENFETAIPFPIPQSALEVLWNHLTRYRGGSVRRTYVQAAPLANGNYTPVYFKQQLTYRDQLTDFDPQSPGNVLFYYRELITSPARLAGDVVMVHETLDQVKEPRKAWIYNAGQRRVRRAPQISYDGPFPASDGQRVADNLDMYNGAPDRYDWKLLGKKEIYVPYNNFQLESADNTYADIIKPGHLNPDLARYELHRVWVIEGTLKAGNRHIYAKRVAYIDEDTWQIVLADHFDARGTLWRVAEGFMTPIYDRQIPWLGIETLNDLINGRYIISGMRNEEKQPQEFGFKASSAEYTPSALRNAGVR
jgi:hypothetical protein